MFLDEYHNILYAPNTENLYEPFAINYDRQQGTYELMLENEQMIMLKAFVDFVRRDLDGGSGEFVVKPLFVYQWSFIIDHVLKVLNPKSLRILNTWARQAKHHWSV